LNIITTNHNNNTTIYVAHLHSEVQRNMELFISGGKTLNIQSEETTDYY